MSVELLKRRRELLNGAAASAETRELIYSYTCDKPILTPVSYDSTNYILEVVNCPDTISDSSSTQSFFIPLGTATTGMPKRDAGITRIDSTHIQVDSYTYGGTLNLNNWQIGVRLNLVSDELSSAFNDVCDYEIEIDGRSSIDDKACAIFWVGGYQTVRLKTTEQNSTLSGSSMYHKIRMTVDKANKTIKVKRSIFKTFTMSGNTITYHDYDFNDETDITFTASPSRFSIYAFICGGTTVKAYKIS